MPEEIYEHIRELAPFKLEFVDEKDDYHKLDSYIKAVYDDYLLIAPAQKNNINYNVPDNSKVNLVFIKDNGILVAQCVVLGKELSAKPGIKVSFPHNTRLLERREYVRIPMKLRLEIFCYKDTAGIEKKSFLAITKNISGSGVAFYHKEPIKNFYEIVCKIYLNDGDIKPVKTKTDLIYSQKVKIKNEDYYLTALTYTSISEPDLARIIKACFKYQISNKKIKDY